MPEIARHGLSLLYVTLRRTPPGLEWQHQHDHLPGMKTSSLHPNHWSLPRPATLVALAAGVWLATGCGKKPAAEAPAPVPVAAATPAPDGQPGLTPPSAPPAVAADPNGGVDLRGLNHAYIGWIVQNRQRPKTYEEFIAKSGLQVPPAPAGRKFVIDENGFIALVNQ